MPRIGDVMADRYRVEALLGAGGMAAVYRAMDLRLAREVAVKVLAPNLAADPSFAARFDREARALVTSNGVVVRKPRVDARIVVEAFATVGDQVVRELRAKVGRELAHDVDQARGATTAPAAQPPWPV